MGQAYKQEFNDVSGAAAMTLGLAMPHPDEPQQPQTTTLGRTISMTPGEDPADALSRQTKEDQQNVMDVGNFSDNELIVRMEWVKNFKEEYKKHENDAPDPRSNAELGISAIKEKSGFIVVEFDRQQALKDPVAFVKRMEEVINEGTPFYRAYTKGQALDQVITLLGHNGSASEGTGPVRFSCFDSKQINGLDDWFSKNAGVGNWLQDSLNNMAKGRGIDNPGKALAGTFGEGANEKFDTFIKMHEEGHLSEKEMGLNEAGADFFATAKFLQKHPDQRDLAQFITDTRATKVMNPAEFAEIPNFKPNENGRLEIVENPNPYGIGLMLAADEALRIPPEKLAVMSEKEIVEKAKEFDLLIEKNAGVAFQVSHDIDDEIKKIQKNSGNNVTSIDTVKEAISNLKEKYAADNRAGGDENAYKVLTLDKFEKVVERLEGRMNMLDSPATVKTPASAMTAPAPDQGAGLVQASITTTALTEDFNNKSGAVAMTLALTTPTFDKSQQQTVTTELREYYNPLSAGNTATVQNMTLNIPNVAPVTPEVHTLAMTVPGAPDGSDINAILAKQAQMGQQNLTQIGNVSKASPMIEIGTPSIGDKIVGNTFRAISFREILDTGNVPQYPAFSIAGMTMGNYSMDLGANDEFTKGLEKVQQETLKEIQKSPEMQKLLDKPSWSTEDRKTWERELSGITSQKMEEVFGEYRSSAMLPNGDLGKNKEVERRSNLNDLSIDLKNNTRKIEFDCEAMSIVKGMVMQRAEDKLLPPASSEGGLKTATEYRYTTSGVDYRGSLSGHAFILSPATMDIIEGTSPIPEQNVDPSNNLARFSKGQPLLTNKFGEGEGDFHGHPKELDGYRKEVSFLESLESVEKMSGIANNFNEKLQNNDGIKNAEETLKNINTPGVDKDARNDMNDMIKQALEDPALKETMGTMKSALGFAKEKWTNLFNQVAGDPQMSAMAKDSFQQNFVNKLGNSTLPVDDGHGGFKTLGEAVREWAQPQIDKLNKTIDSAPKMQAQTPKAEQMALS